MTPLGFGLCSMPHDDNSPRQLYFECPVARCRAPLTSNPPRFCSQSCVAKHAYLNADDHRGGVDASATRGDT